MLGTIGGRAWAEYRATAALPHLLQAPRMCSLIVWDTVRAANLSLYGYGRPTTPNLERLASRGVRFDLAFSTSSWTLPAHASMFTGRWPHELDVDWKSPMRDDVPTLAGYLAAHGYDTAGFVANLDYCNRETGLARGFAHYEDFPIELYDVFARYVGTGQPDRHRRLAVRSWAGCWRNAPGVGTTWFPARRSMRRTPRRSTGRSWRWLARQQARRRPFFAFLNYNDAHTPYEVPDRSIPGFGLRPESSLGPPTLLQLELGGQGKLCVPTTCGWPPMFMTIASLISIGGWGSCSRSSTGAACSTIPW